MLRSLPLMFLGASLLASAPAFAQKFITPSPELLALVTKAAADNTSFKDKYDAQVWLMTMSNRLAATIADPHKRLALLELIHAEATRAGVSPELVLSIINVESDFDRFAVSHAGAQGLMQIMPFWLKLSGQPNGNLFHETTNLRLGCTILKYYLGRSHGDIREALQRYNGATVGIDYSDSVLKALSRTWNWN
ncbi:MAG TPA: lytic transglycosylase domain-containing protein [Gammaproteobacteria bacterium]|nr:lytic transglycosylase domain-containing protein [Gammaproteobacteria bacterium]